MQLTRTVSSTDGSAQGNIRIRRLYWYNPINAGDTVVIQSSGTTQVTLRCENANQSQFLDWDEGLVVNAHQVTTIASGTLYIYS
jgi:hypothetical protein